MTNMYFEIPDQNKLYRWSEIYNSNYYNFKIPDQNKLYRWSEMYNSKYYQINTWIWLLGIDSQEWGNTSFFSN